MSGRGLPPGPSGAATRPRVVVLGRPNVGKSTLVNRIVGRREAIVEERPGVTRDRKAVEASWGGRTFEVIDTGGWSTDDDPLSRKVSEQAARAVGEADVVLFVVDVNAGVTADDAAAARLVRGVGTPVLLVANKADNPARALAAAELWSLGLGEPKPVSALHGTGVADLLDEVVGLLGEPEDAPSAPGGGGAHASGDGIPAVAIVGRPNVGKSTLFNRLVGEERSIVHDLPGTTRDTVDTVVVTPEGPIRFVDTAGMRRRARIGEATEHYSVLRALRAVDTADVALLVIDSTVGVTHQDQRLAERVDAAGCPVVVLCNKWDLLDTEQRERIPREVGRRLGFLGEAPLLRVSAATGRGVHRLLPAISRALEAYRRRVPTAAVNRVVREAQAAHPPPGGARVLYATQGATDPPTFVLFVNRDVPRPWLRYLERRLQEAFDLGATPVKLRVRRR